MPNGTNSAKEEFLSNYLIADGGGAGDDINIDKQYGVVCIRIEGAGETSTLSTPKSAGIIGTLAVERLTTGTRVVTVESGNIDQTNDTITLNTDTDRIHLISVPDAAGTFRWSLLSNIGCGLT